MARSPDASTAARFARASASFDSMLSTVVAGLPPPSDFGATGPPPFDFGVASRMAEDTGCAVAMPAPFSIARATIRTQKTVRLTGCPRRRYLTKQTHRSHRIATTTITAEAMTKDYVRRLPNATDYDAVTRYNILNNTGAGPKCAQDANFLKNEFTCCRLLLQMTLALPTATP